MASLAKAMIKYQGITTLEVLEDAKNYNKWIAKQFLHHISSPTLEIGAGTGNLSQFFIDKKPLYVTDIDGGLVKQLKKRFIDEKHVFAEKFNVSGVLPKKYIRFFKTIYAVNVLEHIEDDVKALKNMHQALKKNGLVLLLVPAKKRAYTQLDKSLGHYRRYEKKELAEKLEQTGFIIEKIYFFNIVGLFGWIVRNKFSKNQKSLSRYQIKIFDALVPILTIFERAVNVPFGISLIVIAKKR